ncbi:MAG TPA: hypothetical protein DCS07_02995 [Bdellovibrionales bacterium]|nr:MAG: hypothetical protein A2Z97_07330 [Bdellovibrionales bacterium GWB1_52_6]OFZ06501.1 MAG: hypothetical protein A2X97_16920 [Bdellovibrionales bacterium GWA1_52_35]OFZ42516.1 MAG: hypothetical protein A2070_11955 [Bdellovibrionales bacterium GWC1_52_8]HAR41590.1 hypothetical protein [Bdellovibrionales bacterium]HCM39505.1 hypothetical protein [Bdellovibrionales bacterium]
MAIALRLWLLCIFCFSPLVHAAEEPTSIDISSVIPGAAAGQIVTTFGILNNHRPYEGAVAIGNKVDLGLEVSLVHLPTSFADTLVQEGMIDDASSFAIGALPTIKAHLHKGLGKKAEIGASGLYFRGNRILGADLKVVIFEPEEGMTWAFRFSYAETLIDLSKFGMKGLPIQYEGVDIGQGGLILNTRTFSPQLLGSVRLDFSEPYIGIGLESTSGQIEVPVTIAVQGYTQTLRTAQTSATQGLLFTGVSFRVPEVGLRLVLEGGYGTLGMSYLGTLVGISL